MNTEKLEDNYQTHDWDVLMERNYQRGDDLSDMPELFPANLNSFSIDSAYAQQLNGRLEKGDEIPSNIFIYDLELLAADKDEYLHNGVQIGEDVDGRIIMEIYTGPTSRVWLIEKR